MTFSKQYKFLIFIFFLYIKIIIKLLFKINKYLKYTQLFIFISVTEKIIKNKNLINDSLYIIPYNKN